MNEKSLKVLEQYDIQVNSTRRGRSSYICETNTGKKLLADYTGSEKKLRFVNQVLEHLMQQGYPFADIVMENKEGNLLSYDRDESAYILKDWYEGRECDTRSMADIEQAVRNLAQLHKMLILSPKEEEAKDYAQMHLGGELERHNRELRKVYSFIRKRKQKNEFEILFLNCFPMFYEQAAEAEKWLAGSDYEELRNSSLELGCICHGNYNQHNIFFLGRRQIFTGSFDKCRYDIQLADLYQFLRKIMEKQDWDLKAGQRILETYDRERRISLPEMNYIYARLFYPEKFWKLANQYYNRSKSWIPWKSTGKLEVLIAQQNKRNSFLKSLE